MKRDRLIRSIFFLGGGLLTLACAQPGDAGVGDTPEGSPSIHQPYRTATPGPGEPEGVVLEVIFAQGYTYARVAAESGEMWIAGPMSDLAAGDTVSLAGADNMGPFESPSLGLEFDQIYFVDGFRRPDPEAGVYQGTVTERTGAGDYTYLRVEVSEEFRWMADPDSDQPLVWIAGPRTPVAVGDVVQWRGGSLMRDFYSNTFQREFAEIVFVDSFTVMR